MSGKGDPIRLAAADDHAAVLKVWSKRRRDLSRTRTQVVCRLHAVHQRDHHGYLAYRGGSRLAWTAAVAYEPSAPRSSPVSGCAGAWASWPACLRTA
jgi:hypothetical protein